MRANEAEQLSTE